MAGPLEGSYSWLSASFKPTTDRDAISHFLSWQNSLYKRSEELKYKNWKAVSQSHNSASLAFLSPKETASPSFAECVLCLLPLFFPPFSPIWLWGGLKTFLPLLFQCWFYIAWSKEAQETILGFCLRCRHPSLPWNRCAGLCIQPLMPAGGSDNTGPCRVFSAFQRFTRSLSRGSIKSLTTNPKRYTFKTKMRCSLLEKQVVSYKAKNKANWIKQN